MAPPRAAVENHMFFSREATKDRQGNIILNKGEGGRVRKLQGERAEVEIFTRGLDRPTVEVPIGTLQIGAKYGKLTVKTGVEHVTVLKNLPPGGNTFIGPTDVKRHFAALLSGIWETRARLPYLEERQKRWLHDDLTKKDTCRRIEAAIKRCSPQLVQVLCTDDFDIDDIARVCRKVTTGNHTAGIYLRIYSDFKKGTGWAGCRPYTYIGQTNDMYNRSRNHAADALNPNHKLYNSHHYQVARAANKCVVVQLIEHDENEGADLQIGHGVPKIGTGLRDIMEQMFMLLFKSYSRRALSWKEPADEQNLATVIAESYEARELCKVYSDIAQLALSKTGFAIPSTPGRKKSFGVDGGLNYQSPLGGERHQTYEKTLWSMVETSDRWIFHKAPFSLNQKEQLYEPPADGFRVLSPKMDKYPHPKAGEKCYISWELMKPNAGEHKAPAFRVPTLGAFEYWTIANKLGFKVVWYSKSENHWRTRYVQLSVVRFLNNEDEGCVRSFACGAGMYAYFTRSTLPSAPSWIPNFGRADVVHVKLDMFKQEVSAKMLTGSLTTLPALTMDLDTARVAMRRLGFENVDGEFKKLDFDWKRDPTSYPDNKLPESVLKGHIGGRNRTACDHCMIIKLAMAGQPKCELIQGTNRCYNCALRGLPCSWSKVSILYGNPTWYLGNKEIRNDPVYQTNVERFLYGPVNEEASSGMVIPDPGYKNPEDLV